MAKCGGSSVIGRRRRVVLFPLPYQGHINPMFRLASALHARGLAITVLHTELHAPDPAGFPVDYRFVAVPDNLPAEVASSEDVAAVLMALNASCAAPFKDRLAALLAEGSVSCVITDVVLFSAQAAARELGVPALGLMTSSAASFQTFMAYPMLLDKGYLPVQEWQKDAPVKELPPFRVKDLQRIDMSSLGTFADLLAHFVAGARRSSGLILNTFDAIEGGVVDKIRQDLSVPVFPVGPLNKLSPPPSIETNLSPQDRGCLDWLGTQAPGSVLFVSLGSVAAVDAHQFVELAWGLADSNRPFLWVVRPGLVRGGLESDSGELELPGEVQEETRDRGRIVRWAPQEEVVGHPAIGAFLTHNGWNSTVEALAEGIPMACLPCFGDQFGTARYACDVWRVGVEVEGVTRLEIRAAIEKLMDDGKEGTKELRERAKDIRAKAEKCINGGGSSHTALLSLVNSIVSF